MTRHADDRRFAWAAVAVVAVAAAVRTVMGTTVLPDGARPKIFWYDEAYAAYIAGRGVIEAALLSGADTTPALFNVLLAVWTGAFGGSDAALMALPFALSLVGVWLTWRLGREVGGAKAGVAAAALVAIAPLHVTYATEVRTYALLYCLSALSFLFLARHLRTAADRDLAAWAAAALAGMYASYTFLVVLLPQAAYLAWRHLPSPRGRVRLASAAASLVIGYLPQILLYRRWSDFFPVAGDPSSFFSRGFTHGGIDAFLEYFSTLAFGHGAFYPSSPLGALFAWMGGAAVALVLAWAAWSARGRETAPLALGAFGAVVAAFAAGFVFAPRYYLAALAPAAALVGTAIVRSPRPRLIGTLAVLALLPFGLRANVPPIADAFKYYAPSFARVIAAEAAPGDLVLADHFTDMLFRRYPPGNAEVALFFPMRGENVTDVAARFRWVDYDFMAEEDYPTLEALTAGRDRVWTVDYLPQRTSLQDPGGLKRRWLDSRFRVAREVRFPAAVPPGVQQITLLLYERK